MKVLMAFFGGFLVAALMGTGLSAAGRLPDWLTALSGVGVLGAAVYGLSTWRAELRAKTNQDVALRLIRGAYLARRRIEVVRNPMMSGTEQPSPPPDLAKEMSKDEIHNYGYAMAMQNRWNTFIESTVDRETAAFDAFALWGERPKELVARLEALERKLFRAVYVHLEERDPSSAWWRRSDTSEESERRSREQHEILYGGPGEDEFKSDYDAAVIALEDYLRPHLRS